MSKPLFGRRTAGAATQSAPSGITFGAAPQNTVLPEGDHEVTIEGARVVSGKSGSASVVPVVKTDTGEYVKVRPMLVFSPGGVSNLVDENRACLAEMAGVKPGEQIDMDTLLKRIAGARVGVQLIETADMRGLPINEIVAAWQL